MSQQDIHHVADGMPRLLYGTAWKEERTAGLTELALRQGFRGIDTANQRRHYHEAGVGEGIAAAIAARVVKRDELWLQTKFTFRGGQDHRLPYDPAAPIATQVDQSFHRSLEHLGVEWLDSYVLHGPSQRMGLGTMDWEAWSAIESLLDRGLVRKIGVSNISQMQLEQLCNRARIAPHIVQNRCYADRGWDRAVRRHCAAHGIIYQGFSLLTANPLFLTHPDVQNIARRHGREATQIVFRLALELGMVALTGTTDPTHMQMDLDVFDFQLTPAELTLLENLLAPDGN